MFEQLTDEILAGSLEPGSSLPAERALAETLGVNRQAVREALQRLSAAGLVEISHGGPTRIRDPHRGGGLALLPRLLIRVDGSVDVGVARSIVELRAVLGPDVARHCAQRATPDEALELVRIVSAMRELTHDLSALASEQTLFWDRLVDGADNIAYRLAFNSLRETYEPIAPLMTEVLADELRDIDGHEDIATAVGAHDPDVAAAAAASVLRRGTDAVNAVLDALPPAAVTHSR